MTKISDAAGGSLDGCRIAVWGLTFKAGTDDRRDSPAVAVASSACGRGGQS